MPEALTLGPIHHVALRVSDLSRSRDFYRDVLGLDVAFEAEDLIFLTNGAVGVGLRPMPDGRDRFDELRVGLDHLSFAVGERDDLDRAAGYLDERGVTRGEIRDLGPQMGMFVMAFRDPDNIQLELTAMHAQAESGDGGR